MKASKKTKGPGPKTKLTESLRLDIRRELLEGLSYKKTQEKLNINPNNWDTWVWKDYQGFREFLTKIKHEIMVRGAEKFSKELMAMDNEKDTIVRIKQKESEFLRETIGKDTGYTKRTENTGKDGADLFPVDQKTKEEADNVLRRYIANKKEENDREIN